MATGGKLGYEVVAISDSREALDVFGKEPHKFDLVITDYAMPHMTGMDLAAELMNFRGDIPIILYTGHIESILPDRAKKAGIREFLRKPVGNRELAEAIRRTLDLQTGTDETTRIPTGALITAPLDSSLSHH